MASISLADQLEDAIERMIAGPDSRPRKVDGNIGELLEIARELLLVPDPEFRASLQTELLRQRDAVPLLARIEIRSRASKKEPTRAAAGVDDILPTLFGAGCGSYPVRRGNFAVSVAIHAMLIASLATAGLWTRKAQPLAAHSFLVTDVSPYLLPQSMSASRGGGGGGDREKIAESGGRLPDFAREQITPPTIIVRREQPKLPEEPTVVGPPALPGLHTSQIGNPLSAILEPPSNGPGFAGGLGSGTGGGVGSGGGPGVGPGYGGGMGGGVYRVGGGVSAPRAIYDPDPEYSDEARKAKCQGTVLLWLIVGPDGKPRDIRVQQSLGMGLDERAVEAVRKWKFEPAMKDGRPVAVQVNVEISFRLF